MPSIGGSSAPSRPPRGALWVNVQDFGAKADNGATDNSVAFQAAIDFVASRAGTWSNHGGVVFVPSAPTPYGFSKPVFLDQNGVSLLGEARETTELMMVGTGQPVVIVGIRRAESYSDSSGQHLLQIDSTNRVDCFGKLDATAAPAAGVRYGIRTNGNSFLQFQSTPFTLGVKTAAQDLTCDNWATTTAVTVEFCVEPPDGQAFLPGAPLVGSGSIDPPIPAPFWCYIWTDPRTILVLYRRKLLPATDPSGYDGFYFALPPSVTPPYRIAYSIDLAAGQRRAFVNGVAVTVSDVKGGPPGGNFTPSPGDAFVANRYEPWYVGQLAINGNTGRPSTGVDLRCYGLRVSRVARYKADGSGNQVRTDSSAAPNDAWAYFGDDGDTVAYLPFDDAPTSSRMVPVANGGSTYGGRSSGLFLHLRVPDPVVNVDIRDLSLNGTSAYGFGVALGSVLEVSLERLKVWNTAYAIGSLVRRDNYRIYVRDCHLTGFESAYMGFFQIVTGERITFGMSGRSSIKMIGCSDNWRDMMVTGYSSNTEYTYEAIGSGFGGNHSLSNLTVDFEGVTYSPGGAAIYCEAHPNVPITSLRLRDIFLGTLGTNVSMIQLVGGTLGPNFQPGWFDAENVQAYTGERPVLSLDGPLWHGSLRGLNSAIGAGIVVTNSQRYGSVTNVTVPQ